MSSEKIKKAFSDKDYLPHAQELSRTVAQITSAAGNEANLCHEIEKILEQQCHQLGIAWTPYQLERAVSGGESKSTRRTKFIDVAHGAVIIEYEPPTCFHGVISAALLHARAQAEEYAKLLSVEEGRAIGEYILVAWDGSHINFGKFDHGLPMWDMLTSFDEVAAQKLLRYLAENGSPLVHPGLLAALVGPASPYGSELIPLFFTAIRASQDSATSKTFLLFTEWKRLFGQVVGVQSERLKTLLREQGIAHQQRYEEDSAAYLFALNTYIALIAKLVAALSLPNSSQNIADQSVHIAERIRALEAGTLFLDAGVSNMLCGDFFFWYQDDAHWNKFSAHIDRIVARLSTVNFDVSRKSADSIRDLFKGLYQTFVPPALRHALGEFYTPDWLAAYALDSLGWSEECELLDPTCGSGTFLLEALKRRLKVRREGATAEELLRGLYGFDLNPLAVLTAKGSLVVYLAPYLDPHKPIRIPVFLADAINSAHSVNGVYYHSLQTERGVQSFAVPEQLMRHEDFLAIFSFMHTLIDAGLAAQKIFTAIQSRFGLEYLSPDEAACLRTTISTLVELHQHSWNSIWSSIIADRFAAGAVPPGRFICGNPPWVKWSHLPPEYAAFIKPRCLELGVFSRDRWVGGIESDISTVITYEVADKWLSENGKLAFFITGTVFNTESSAGFRRFELEQRKVFLHVEQVEDFKEINPFEGVSNHATLLILSKGRPTTYPVPYRTWHTTSPTKTSIAQQNNFFATATVRELLACPMPGLEQEGGPWLKGTKEEHAIWQRLFAPGERYYKARKGVTTDRNGIFWLQIQGVNADKTLCRVQNAATIGRTTGIPTVQGNVESEHVFPLLRGRGVSAFRAVPEPELHILVPQRGMHGDPDLPITHPHTYAFLRHFESYLRQRSSLRRFQKNQPYWSLWSTGNYTFAPYKVLWKEMSGATFVAAYCGPFDDPLLGPKIIIPDHKLYFVPVETEAEAAYLTSLLNAPMLSHAIGAYAAQLSLGVSVVEYLNIPPFDEDNTNHVKLAELGMSLTRKQWVSQDDYEVLDECAQVVMGI